MDLRSRSAARDTEEPQSVGGRGRSERVRAEPPPPDRLRRVSEAPNDPPNDRAKFPPERLSESDRQNYGSCLSDSLSYKSVVGQGLAMRGSAEYEAEEFLLPPSAIEAVGELGEVAGHVFPAHTMERSAQPGLEVAEDAVDPRQDFSGSGRVLPLNDPFMIEPDFAETAVALKRIGAHRGVVGIDGPTDEGA